jgi:peptidoglycan hydrolase CwlO-like protein
VGHEQSADELRQAFEELSRRVLSDRLAFADRVQEAVDDAQQFRAAIEHRDRQIEQLQRHIDKLQTRIDSVEAELAERHRLYERLAESKSVRYTAPFRRLAGALRQRR